MEGVSVVLTMEGVSAAEWTYRMGLFFNACSMVVNPGLDVVKLWKKSAKAKEDAQVYGEHGYLGFLTRMVYLLNNILLFWYSPIPIAEKHDWLKMMASAGATVEVTFAILVMLRIETKEKRIDMGLILCFFSLIMAPLIIGQGYIYPKARSELGAAITLIMSVLTLIQTACELKNCICERVLLPQRQSRADDESSSSVPTERTKPVSFVLYYTFGLNGYGFLFANSLLVHDYVVATYNGIASLLNGAVLIASHLQEIKDAYLASRAAILWVYLAIHAAIFGQPDDNQFLVTTRQHHQP